MSWFSAPKDLPTRVWARLPDALRAPRVSAWSRTNKAGVAIDSFLERPCFLCFGGPDCSLVFITDSETGQVLVAEAPFPG